jgi:hypothetical protein
MHVHPSTCLEGPVSAARPWWRTLDEPAPRAGARPGDNLDRPPAEDDPGFRADLVARIRREIAEGRYGTDEQLEQAVRNLLERLRRGEA